jgi:hypothetical protein
MRRRQDASSRILRLVARAFARRVWPLLDDRSRRAIEVAEAFADVQAAAEELRTARASRRHGGAIPKLAPAVYAEGDPSGGHLDAVRLSRDGTGSDRRQ